MRCVDVAMLFAQVALPQQETRGLEARLQVEYCSAWRSWLRAKAKLPRFVLAQRSWGRAGSKRSGLLVKTERKNVSSIVVLPLPPSPPVFFHFPSWQKEREREREREKERER